MTLSGKWPAMPCQGAALGSPCASVAHDVSSCAQALAGIVGRAGAKGGAGVLSGALGLEQAPEPQAETAL
jgi:hypothetical protein